MPYFYTPKKRKDKLRGSAGVCPGNPISDVRDDDLYCCGGTAAGAGNL